MAIRVNATWKQDLAKIRGSDDLHIAPFREDGVTYGTPTWIWSVVVDNDLFVRAYHGKKSTWYQAALKQKAGRINVAGIIREVLFEEATGVINNKIDEAYREKYKGNPYLNAMTGDRARSATVRILPN